MAEAAVYSVHASSDQKDLLTRYIECAEHLIEKCQELSEIPGAGKLERKCAAELKYLKSLARRRGGYDVTHLRSSNLGHYAGVLHAADNLPNVTHILQAFSCPGRTESLHMDVVAGQGHIWVKVIARKAQALHLIWGGQGQYGEKDIVMQAKDFVVCSKVHPVNFQDPQVVFAFYNGVTHPILERLQKSGVCVLGETVEVDSDVDMKLLHISADDSCSDEESSSESENEFDPKDDDKDNGNERENSEKPCVCLKREQIFKTMDGNNQPSHCLICGKESKDKQVLETNQASKDETGNHKSTFSQTHISEIGSPNQITQSQFSTPDDIQCDTVSMSKDKNGSERAILSQVDLVNNSEEYDVCNLDKWNSTSILSFIRAELLLNPGLDFRVIRRILADNQVISIDKIGKINLDITALITLVSSVAHGGCYFRFREKILSEQAAEERSDPVLPKLEAFIKGKELYACQTAVDSFQKILDTLGGPHEKKRSLELLSKLTIVPDQPSFRTSMIPNTGKIKDRSKVIFGTGDSLKAVTVTANSGFVRAAEHQGVTFAVFLHASRALTELKENTAEMLNIDSKSSTTS